MQTGQLTRPMTLQQQLRALDRENRRLKRQVRRLETQVQRLPRYVRRDWSNLSDAEVE